MIPGVLATPTDVNNRSLVRMQVESGGVRAESFSNLYLFESDTPTNCIR